MTKSDFRAALEDLLKVSRGTLRDDDSRQTVERWSSLVDVQIMVLAATELNIEDAEMLDYDTVGELMLALGERGAFAG